MNATVTSFSLQTSQSQVVFRGEIPPMQAPTIFSSREPSRVVTKIQKAVHRVNSSICTYNERPISKERVQDLSIALEHSLEDLARVKKLDKSHTYHPECNRLSAEIQKYLLMGKTNQQIEKEEGRKETWSFTAMWQSLLEYIGSPKTATPSADELKTALACNLHIPIGLIAELQAAMPGILSHSQEYPELEWHDSSTV